MTRAIDVRDEQDSPVTAIIFGDESNGDEDGRDVAHKLLLSVYHDKHIFIEDSQGEYAVIRRKDVPYLIKALQAAQDLWEGCK